MIETLEALVGVMRQDGAVRIYAKKLAPNDNSKNQIYLGGDFSALNVIPHGEVRTDDAEVAGSVRDRAKASVRFLWIDEGGRYPAPNAQLILYPKYPEVRMSGFLKGAKLKDARQAPGDVMRVRDEGRVLFLGITRDGTVLGYAVPAGSPIARAFEALRNLEPVGVFLEIPSEPAAGSTKERLLETLEAIYRKHWIPSQKLDRHGVKQLYAARNGGGYTLEAELGITPNSYAEPDYLGWEIKQYGVRDFKGYRPTSVVTLMTPEPTGGFYRDNGAEAFVRRFGYPDKSGKTGRINFGGIYASTKPFHAGTGLQLRMTGYDMATDKITDMDGGIALLDRRDEVAALWKFPGIIEHWSRKHAQAAYVPSLFRTPPPEYRYGPRILLCEQTDLALFLKAVADGTVYYDPALKIEPQTGLKRRSQFRIRHNQLERMYHQSEVVDMDV
ncbi:hypothetical protein D8666_13275 [Ochrobactrum soli]|uniref:MvaI/BcnI family restriction endonuclease n=1 Tax=Ochrobactrum soli TaxID=2448455 RepID=UPI000EF20C50|nr:MvaI/BcnI family restriction endonuclease [[Ochrobactrum] soli]RLL74180.1 hypothetical protein D8666_13275 [[Ochrobactrum] soli]